MEGEGGAEGAADKREALPRGSFTVPHTGTEGLAPAPASHTPQKTKSLNRRSSTSTAINRNSRFPAQHNCINSEAYIMECLTVL